MIDMEESEDGRRRQVLDALGFQLSMQFWVAVLSGIAFGIVALIAWTIR